MASPVDLAAQGYVEEEFLLAGDATAYAKSGEWGRDGKWDGDAQRGPPPTRPACWSAARPRPTKFNGTVVVEWFNVTCGMDASPDFGYSTSSSCAAATSGWACPPRSPASPPPPSRNPPLQGPQPSRRRLLLRHLHARPGGPCARASCSIEDYGIKAVIAAGESQSAILLTTYVNAVDPLVKVYDGFFVHSRFAAAGGAGRRRPRGPNPAEIRDDTEVPVIVVLSETDIGFNLATRQPDGERFRLWEIAGTAHADQYLINLYVPPSRGNRRRTRWGAPSRSTRRTSTGC